MVRIFKKKCKLCNVRISRGEEVWEYVKVPELLGLRKKPFCCKDHAEFYKNFVCGTPSKSMCMKC